MMHLKGKSVLVTGAARGVGEAIALMAAREGALITAVDIEPQGLELLLETAQSQGLTIKTVVADISTRAGNERAVAAAEERFGALEAFIANAAVIRFADALATTDGDWESVLAVNLRGVHLGIQSALPSLRRAGGGSLILLSSVLGIVGDAVLPAYGATKGALRALCRSVAVAYGPEGIRCNTICPGDTETDMMRAQIAREPDPKAARALMVSHYPLGRFASPEDVAHAAIFLASDCASYITGTDLIVDGGLLAKCY